MIGAKDVDDALEGFYRSELSASEWCAKNDVQEPALERIVEMRDRLDPRVFAICLFMLGYQARRQVEPKGMTAQSPGETPRYVVQHVVIDTTDGTIVHGPQSPEGYVVNLAELMTEQLDQARPAGR